MRVSERQRHRLTERHRGDRGVGEKGPSERVGAERQTRTLGEDGEREDASTHPGWGHQGGFGLQGGAGWRPGFKAGFDL